MAKTTQATTILLVSNTPSLFTATRHALGNYKDLALVNEKIDSQELLSIIGNTQPDVVLWDYEFDPDPSDLLKKIASKNPKSAVVVILPESQEINLDQLDLKGARGFIRFPYQPGMLATSIQRAIESLEGGETNSSSSSTPDSVLNHKNTFIVFSPKGGAGTTTLATNLAISLHKTLNEDVLLIDGKHFFGHVALYLNLRTGNSITDLIAHADSLDERLIKQVVIRHTSGIFVLPCPNSIVEAQGIKPDGLYKVIQGLQEVFPNIIIDGGNNLNVYSVTYMDSSDNILLLLNPDLASMRDVRQFMQVSGTLAYPKEKILLILNLTGRKADVKREEIEKILNVKIFGKIPADDNLALSCINEGVPILLKKPRHPISAAFSKIAKDLVELTRSTS